MNIQDALKEKGNPFEIDCSRNDLPGLFKSLGFKVGAEIGVQRGYNFKLYCDAGFKMYGIDPWSNGNTTQWDRYHEDFFKKATKLASNYPDVTIIRKTSMDALEDIPKRSLDFVYIDGAHDFINVALDLNYWTDKVRRGGVIAGHDYYNDAPHETRNHRAVGPVVKAFCESKDIYKWWIMGRGFKENMSFMFFKHW